MYTSPSYYEIEVSAVDTYVWAPLTNPDGSPARFSTKDLAWECVNNTNPDDRQYRVIMITREVVGHPRSGIW